MDTATLATLKTVCIAGRASEGFNAESNAQLKELADEGLLTEANENAKPARRRSYKPTQKGRELVRQIDKQGAA
jgi:hypothetical protein